MVPSSGAFNRFARRLAGRSARNTGYMLPGFIASALILFCALALWFTAWAEKKVGAEVVEDLALIPAEETQGPAPLAPIAPGSD